MEKRIVCLNLLFEHSFHLGASDALMFIKLNNKPGCIYHNDYVAACIVVKINVLINCVKDQAITHKHSDAVMTGTVYDLRWTCIGWVRAYTDVLNCN